MVYNRFVESVPRFEDVDARVKAQEQLKRLRELKAARVVTEDMLKVMDRMAKGVISLEERKRYEDRLAKVLSEEKSLRDSAVTLSTVRLE